MARGVTVVEMDKMRSSGTGMLKPLNGGIECSHASLAMALVHRRDKVLANERTRELINLRPTSSPERIATRALNITLASEGAHESPGPGLIPAARLRHAVGSNSLSNTHFVISWAWLAMRRMRQR
jgi:hypothetical protein